MTSQWIYCIIKLVTYQIFVKQEVVVSMLKRSLIGTIILFFLTFLIPAGCARCSKLPLVWKTALG